jgi:hypothetical protein
MTSNIENSHGEALEYEFAEGERSNRKSDQIILLGHGVTGNMDRPVITDTPPPSMRRDSTPSASPLQVMGIQKENLRKRLSPRKPTTSKLSSIRSRMLTGKSPTPDTAWEVPSA